MSAERYDESGYAELLVSKGLDAETAKAVAYNCAAQGSLPLIENSPQRNIADKAEEIAQRSSWQAKLKSAEKVADKDEAPPQEKSEDQGTPPKKKETALTKRTIALIDAGLAIKDNEPQSDDLTFMHSIMCQVGLPRSKVDGERFERICGNAGLYVQAGVLWDGRKFVKQPVPFGPMPRLIMAYMNTFALRHKTMEIAVGNSASEMLKMLGKDVGGGPRGSYTSFQTQAKALAACSLTIGFTSGSSAFTYDGKPIRQFEAWLSDSEMQPSLWPGVITLSEDYFNTLKDHAVPLDMRALGALKGSAMAMDVYAMLSERLHRISGRPLILHWKSLRDQFGQEFTGANAEKDFKRTFLAALKKAMEVYPDAKVKQVRGGLLLIASPPPIPYKM